MKERDLDLLPINSYDPDTSGDVTEDRFVDNTEDRERSILGIFEYLGVLPAPSGISPGRINLFALLKHGVENSDVDLAVVLGTVLGFLRRYHADDVIRMTWEHTHTRLHDFLFEYLGQWPKSRAKWVQEMETKYPDPGDTEKRNADCMRRLKNFALSAVKSALKQVTPERYLVQEQVEEYLKILRDRGDLGRWCLTGNKGYKWYLSKWELPDLSPEDQVRHLGTRPYMKPFDEVKDSLDAIPMPPVNLAGEMKRMERMERGAKSPAKPVFDYATHLPGRIITSLELYSAPLHTSQIKDLILSCLSRRLDAEADKVALTGQSFTLKLYSDKGGTDDVKDLSMDGDTPLNAEEMLIEREEQAIYGSDEERRKRRLRNLMDQSGMNDRRKQLLALLAAEPACVRNQTTLADRIGCSRNTIKTDLKFLGKSIGFSFFKDDED